MDISSEKIRIEDLLDLKRNNMLTVNPEYQRGAVWKDIQQKKLVDSVLRSYPLPLIYLHHKKKTVAGMQREDLEIIDGQQRINALLHFAENSLKLFDPIKDDKIARFPKFIKNSPCPWAGCSFIGLPQDLKNKFNNTELFIVKIITDNEDEARDLFIRLQAGLPLNPQEKRDAWPGGYTEFVLNFGGKNDIIRYQGHDFFKKIVKQKNASADRGATRTLCAQIGMLFFERATENNWMDIGTQAIDDYYYKNLDFDINGNSVNKFSKVLDTAVEIFSGYKGKKLEGYEAIDVILLINSLSEDYTRSWQNQFFETFDKFRKLLAEAKKNNEGDFFSDYGRWTSTQASNSYSLYLRHRFFSEFFIRSLNPKLKDPTRLFGQLDREIIYYRDNKKCAKCKVEIKWEDLEIHHIEEHQSGGATSIENGIAVHRLCHPKGLEAVAFNEAWKLNKRNTSI